MRSGSRSAGNAGETADVGAAPGTTLADVQVSSLLDEITAEVERAVGLREALVRRSGGWMINLFERHFTTDVLSDEGRRRMEDVATDAERQDQLFRIVVSRYWVVALSHHISTAFGITARDGAALLALHRLRHQEEARLLRSFSPTAIATIAIAGTGLVASQLPKESFEVLGGDDDAYGWYRLVLAAFIAGVLIFVAVKLLFLGGTERRQRVLTITETILKSVSGSTPNGEGGTSSTRD